MCRICLRGHDGETLVQILAVQALAGHCQGAVAQDACPTPQVNITLKEVQVMPCIPPVFSSGEVRCIKPLVSRSTLQQERALKESKRVHLPLRVAQHL